MSTNFPFVDRIVQNSVLSHILFWCSFLLIFTLLGSLNSGSFSSHLINYLALLPSQLAAAYFLNYYQIPTLFLKKRYVHFVISFLVSGYVFVVFARICTVHIAEPLTREGMFEKETFLEILADPFYLFYVYFPAVYVIVFLMMAIKSIKRGFEEKHQLEVLQKEKATTELQFLKAQIHPHFLFNTLNSIYALTLTKSDAAPEVVLKLSEMLDYILYQCNEPTIALHKEITLIQGYIDLEKIRYGDQLDLEFIHELSDKQRPIAPLILLGFIENAFKHGASKNPINPKIHIQLQEKESQVYLRVYNTKISVKSDVTSEQSKGIGITNVSRQLELHYPNAHTLKIEDTETSYEVQLTIDLTNK